MQFLDPILFHTLSDTFLARVVNAMPANVKLTYISTFADVNIR